MNDLGSPVSFVRDILPLFRPVDIEHMTRLGVALGDYAYMSVKNNAQKVYASLQDGFAPRMPPGGPYWSETQLQLFAKWMADGLQP